MILPSLTPLGGAAALRVRAPEEVGTTARWVAATRRATGEATTRVEEPMEAPTAIFGSGASIGTMPPLGGNGAWRARASVELDANAEGKAATRRAADITAVVNGAPVGAPSAGQVPLLGKASAGGGEAGRAAEVGSDGRGGTFGRVAENDAARSAT